MTTYRTRDGVHSDIDTLIEFTKREALEAERLALHDEDVRRGVERAFSDTAAARYWVAEHSALLVGSISVVREWSNFRGAYYWWVQSLYVVPEHRGTGLAGQLIAHVSREAQAAGALQLRLYAHAKNERALKAYERMGFTSAPYVILARTPDA